MRLKFNLILFGMISLFGILMVGVVSAWGTTCVNTQPNVEWNIDYNNATNEFLVGYRSTYCLQPDEIYTSWKCGEQLDYAMHGINANFCWTLSNGAGGTGNNVWLFDCVGNPSECCGSSSVEDCQANIDSNWNGAWQNKCYGNKVGINPCTGGKIPVGDSSTANFVKTVIPPFLSAQTLPECSGPGYTGKGYKTAWKYQSIKPNELENLMVASYSFYHGDDTHCERTRVTKLGIAELPNCEYEQSTGLFSGDCCEDNLISGIKCGPVKPVCQINTSFDGIDYAETVSPNVIITSSATGVAGDISLIKDNNYSTFYGIGENQHHNGYANMSLTYVFSDLVNLDNITYTRSITTAGASSDTEKQIEKVIVWDNSGERVVYDRNIVYGGNSGTAPGGSLENKTIEGPFNGVSKIEFYFYAYSHGASSDRFTRIRIYELSINEGEPEVECCGDSDCGVESIEKTCDLNDSVITTNTPKCSVGKCEIDTQVERVTCDNGCANGECLNPIKCDDDSDCEVTFCLESDNYCSVSGFNVFHNFLEPICINPGTPESHCSSNVLSTIIANCIFGCSNGDCII